MDWGSGGGGAEWEWSSEQNGSTTHHLLTAPLDIGLSAELKINPFRSSRMLLCMPENDACSKNFCLRLEDHALAVRCTLGAVQWVHTSLSN